MAKKEYSAPIEQALHDYSHLISRDDYDMIRRNITPKEREELDWGLMHNDTNCLMGLRDLKRQAAAKERSSGGARGRKNGSKK
ncbi:MAG: hypothetical protein IJT94_16155 [Oscillibacter sp.]|nr:hypothetical protein [Oscillibacter sp.]